MRSVVVVLLGSVAWVSTARANDQVAAEAAFVKAKQLSADGRWSEACPLFEASYRADPALGALVNLADCHEHIQKTATAWAELREALDIARKKGDQQRIDFATEHLAALEPRLDKLHLDRPPDSIPGLVVRRGDTDMTAFLGTDTPVDPGSYTITASAPGYTSWSHPVDIAGEGTSATLQIPALVRDAVVSVEPMITIRTPRPDAQITLDGRVLGTGSYTGPMPVGGHTLRVVSAGMKPYQTEISAAVGQSARTIDVPLEAIITVGEPRDTRPRFAFSASVASGVKLHEDDPGVLAIRPEIAVRVGGGVLLGFYAELGRFTTGGSCGYEIPGSAPSSPFDVGPRNQFSSCGYIMPGLDLHIPLHEGRVITPYLGISPGFRFGFAHYTPFFAGVMQSPRQDSFLAIVTAVRAGADYHKHDSAWTFGGFAEAAITIIGDETPDGGDTGGHTQVVGELSVLFGVQSRVGF